MPHVTINGCSYFYDEAGDGPETIVFGHGYLMTHRLFEPQVDALKDQYRCIRIDWRGQGSSSVTDEGYDLPSLTADLAALIRELDAAPCHYVGHSMGGFVGFRLLLHHPDLVQSATLINTQAEAEPLTKRIQYQAMLRTLRIVGFDPLMPRVTPLLFGPAFRKQHEDEVERWTEIITSNDTTGLYHTGQTIFSRDSVLPELGGVRTPVLLVAGADDAAIPVERMKNAHEALPDADLVIIPKSGHSAPIEQPGAVNQALTSFLARQSAAESTATD